MTTGMEICDETCHWTGMCVPPEEECNGMDEDCDGVADNGFECTMGESFSCPTPCGSEGMKVCGFDCTWGECQNPVEECNGVDDDCDGIADNGFECIMGTVESCSTWCGSEGTITCDNYCICSECVPPAEICNGVDDDCDGTADNGFECIQGETISCTTTCGSSGTGYCSDSCTIPAGADCYPPAEECNGLDDDCDGVADNGFECVMGAIETCTTSCGSEGTKTCEISCTLSDCIPPDEICNGVDDDCDGFVDENYAKIDSDVRITSSAGRSRYASLVFTGSKYGVSWVDERDGNYEIYFARISCID